MDYRRFAAQIGSPATCRCFSACEDALSLIAYVNTSYCVSKSANEKGDQQTGRPAKNFGAR